MKNIHNFRLYFRVLYLLCCFIVACKQRQQQRNIKNERTKYGKWLDRIKLCVCELPATIRGWESANEKWDRSRMTLDREKYSLALDNIECVVAFFLGRQRKKMYYIVNWVWERCECEWEKERWGIKAQSISHTYTVSHNKNYKIPTILSIQRICVYVASQPRQWRQKIAYEAQQQKINIKKNKAARVNREERKKSSKSKTMARRDKFITS